MVKLKDLLPGEWFQAYGHKLRKTEHVGIGYSVACMDKKGNYHYLREDVEVERLKHFTSHPNPFRREI